MSMVSNQINQQEGFLLFKQFLSASYGILLNDDQRQLVASKLSVLLKSYSIHNFHDLLMRMKKENEADLRAAVIDAITINETSWCRDQYPFEILKKIILPEIHRKRPTEVLRIWSAACSYGQEPYSISMVIEEVKRMHPTYFLSGSQIIATDISDRALVHARKGEYETNIMQRGLPKAWEKLFFEAVDDNHWRIKEELKEPIKFKFFNLVDSYSALGKFDVIFCCNVLVYFSPETKKDILKRMHAALKPGGYLIVGAMEVISGVHNYYQIIQCNPGIIYRAIEKKV